MPRSRRAFLQSVIPGSVGMLVACTQVPSSPAATPSSALAEGALTLMCTPATTNQDVLDVFSQLHPEIKLEVNMMSAAQFGTRALSEQRQGLYAWDCMFMTGLNTAEQTLAPATAMGDIRPFVSELPPDVTDDAKWAGGFKWFRSDDSPDSIITDLRFSYGVYVNRGKIPESQLSSVDQLADPQFKGQFVSLTLGVGASSQTLATMLANGKSEDLVKKIVFDQQPAFFDNSPPMAEFLVTGRSAMALACSQTFSSPIGIRVLARTSNRCQRNPAISGWSPRGYQC